jgi:hypothetical protein
MKSVLHDQKKLAPRTRAFYCKSMDLLNEADIPYLVGGAYAFAHYTGITRHTKDFDVFLRHSDVERALAAFAGKGYRTDFTFPHWLAKVYSRDNFIDLIFSSGNGLVEVDDDWFRQAEEGEVFGRKVRVSAPEEMICSKAFIMERERYDGADIHHLLRARAARLDWSRLLRRFGGHWRLLLSHLILFGYVYPAERNLIPAAVMDQLLSRLHGEIHTPPLAEHVCQGTLLSRSQYLHDLEVEGYEDARLAPRGKMTPAMITRWTDAIGNDHPGQEKNGDGH